MRDFVARRFLLIFAAIAAMALGNASPSSTYAFDGSVWVGEYDVSGKNPDGSAYKGTATISQHGEGYRMQWRIAGKRFAGTGVASKRSLAVGAPGWVVIYERAEIGELFGAWIAPNGTQRGFERLTAR